MQDKLDQFDKLYSLWLKRLYRASFNICNPCKMTCHYWQDACLLDWTAWEEKKRLMIISFCHHHMAHMPWKFNLIFTVSVMCKRKACCEAAVVIMFKFFIVTFLQYMTKIWTQLWHCIAVNTLNNICLFILSTRKCIIFDKSSLCLFMLTIVFL